MSDGSLHPYDIAARWGLSEHYMQAVFECFGKSLEGMYWPDALPKLCLALQKKTEQRADYWLELYFTYYRHRMDALRSESK